MLQGTNSGRYRTVSVPGGNPANRGGFDVFFRAEYVRLVRFIRRAGGTHEEAEDAAATAMTSAYRSWAVLTNPGTWVRTTALRYYIRQIQRDQAGVARSTLVFSGAAATPGGDNPDPGEHDRVLAVLRTLPPAQLEVMALVVDGYGPAEIAVLVDKQPATVRANLREARRKLEHLLAAHVDQPAVYSSTAAVSRNGEPHAA